MVKLTSPVVKRLRNICFVIAIAFPCIGFSQLSKGEGAMATVPGKNLRCYVPKFFSVQQEPPGVMHKESGTFVILVKVPAEKKASVKEGLSRSFFEDPRYTILSLSEGDSSIHKLNTRGKLYTLRYKIQEFEFERKTLLLTQGGEQYLIIANYYIKFKPQVRDEVEKVMANFIIK